MRFREYWEQLFSVLFPPLCVGCDEVLLHQEEFLCAACQFHLPVNDHYLFPNNDVIKRFWGKAEVCMAASYLSFEKSSVVQNIIHQLKYKGRYRIGQHLGAMFGKALLASPYFQSVDVVVPIPLHVKKKRARGYNQSEYIARGIAKAMGLPMNNKSLIRCVNTASQTTKQRLDRFDNMENVFATENIEAIEGLHVLLVDDVLTTGATLASAAHLLKETAGCQISIAVLAMA